MIKKLRFRGLRAAALFAVVQLPHKGKGVKAFTFGCAYPVGMMSFLWTLLGSFALVLSGTGVLHLLPRSGAVGCRISAALARAPCLDGVMTYFIVLPLALGALAGGWAGLAAAVIGQLLGLLVWTGLHELAHPQARQGPRIVKVLNRVLGTWRNHAALWVMLPAVPLFWLVRMVQMTIYPALVRLVGLPRYRTGEWVNVSRHKFEGLVGHDLIWCLYCDWMTGLWSLGTEMLRNVESLWCPIRFAEGKKCENCALDFPDVAPGDGRPGWVQADGTMGEVAELLENQYGQTSSRGWYGHPARLTIEGRDVAGSPRQET